MNKKKYAVIVAGGSGTRLGSSLPKQFIEVKGYPVLWWSLKAFHEEDPSTEIIVVIPEKYSALWLGLVSNLREADRISHILASGGKSRSESVKAGLDKITDEEGIVAIHDGARPLLTPELLRRGWEAVKRNDAAIPVVGLTDSIRKIDGNGRSHSVDRSEFVAVQTPQLFNVGLIKEAYNSVKGDIFTDDASIVENFGKDIALFEGDVRNRKITNPGDIEIAKEMLKGLYG